MLQKFSFLLLAAFLVSVLSDAAGNVAFAGDRTPKGYQSEEPTPIIPLPRARNSEEPTPPTPVPRKYKSVDRTQIAPLPPHRGMKPYRAAPITKAGISRQDNRYYYLSKEDERYLDRVLRDDPSRTIRLPSGMVIQFNVSSDPGKKTIYTPVKPLLVLP